VGSDVRGVWRSLVTMDDFVSRVGLLLFGHIWIWALGGCLRHRTACMKGSFWCYHNLQKRQRYANAKTTPLAHVCHPSMPFQKADPGLSVSPHYL